MKKRFTHLSVKETSLEVIDQSNLPRLRDSGDLGEDTPTTSEMGAEIKEIIPAQSEITCAWYNCNEKSFLGF